MLMASLAGPEAFTALAVVCAALLVAADAARNYTAFAAIYALL